MIKNKQHSFLVKRLHNLREQVNYYLISLNVAKSNLTTSWFNPCDEYKLKYKLEIEECRYMIDSLSKEIREIKEEIYKIQNNYLLK